MSDHDTSANPVSMSTTRRTRTSMRWSTADIAVGAALGVACGIIAWAFNFAYAGISPILGALLPGFASIVHAVWYFSGTLAMLVIRKPGAAIYVNVLGIAVQMLVGNQFSFGFIFISAILQGAFTELPFALTRYRVYTLPVTILSAITTGLEYGFYLLFFQFQGVAILSPRGITSLICEVVGSIIIAGFGSWFLFQALARTGVLDHLASGRAVRAAAMSRK